MKLTKDNVLEKWGDAKLILQDKKEFIDLAEDSFIPFANLYDEFDEDMKKDFDSFLDTANKLLEEKENKREEVKPKFKVGDWVTTKIYMDDGSVQESEPLLISEFNVTPDGRVVYTFDGGDIDMFEDEIIRKTTDPNKKKEKRTEYKGKMYDQGGKQKSDIQIIADATGLDKDKLKEYIELADKPKDPIKDEKFWKMIQTTDNTPISKIMDFARKVTGKHVGDGKEGIDMFHQIMSEFVTDAKRRDEVVKSYLLSARDKTDDRFVKDAKDAKDLHQIAYMAKVNQFELVKKVAKDAEKNRWNVDLKKMERRYKDAVNNNDFKKMMYLLEYLTECNYHTERHFFEIQDWKRLHESIKQNEKEFKNAAKQVKEGEKKEPKPDPYASATPVEALSPEVKLIKRVITLQGKTMKKANADTKNNPRTILNALQRAILSKQIRKTSKYADEVMYAQDALIRIVNGALSGALSNSDVINLVRYDDLVKVANSEVVSETAKIASQFIKIQEKEGKQKEAENLLKRIDKSGEKGEEIDGMKKALKNYVEGKTSKLKASEQVLKGLHGIVDVNFESGEVVNSTTIEGKNFDTLDFHGRWEGFFGKPSPDFKFMFYGKPGNGKSTFALQFAGYLSKELGKSVLYVANEEGFGYTLQEKVKRLNVANSNLYLCDSVPEDLSQFDVVFLDSVNNLGLEPEDLKAMPAGKAYVYIFQTTKDGNYMGKQEFAHDVDAVVRVENFNAYKDKNRYGGEIQEFKVG
jgi:hypothetical protein